MSRSDSSRTAFFSSLSVSPHPYFTFRSRWAARYSSSHTCLKASGSAPSRSFTYIEKFQLPLLSASLSPASENTVMPFSIVLGAKSSNTPATVTRTSGLTSPCQLEALGT